MERVDRPRPPTVAAVPTGLTYLPEFLDEVEADELWRLFEGWPFDELRLHGRAARRTARHFGTSYDLQDRRTGPAPDPPPELQRIRARAADAAGIDAEEFREMLVLRYPAGSGIGWHRDAPQFGAPVFGISLGAACTLRFQRKSRGVRQVHRLDLEPRSAYLLDGAARWSWQHAIPITPATRYSITLRTVNPPAGTAAGRS